MADQKIECICSVCGILYSERQSRVGRLPMCSGLCRNSDKALLIRFLSYVNKTSTCWLWTGALGAGGYGKFTSRKVTHLAHRFLYEKIVCKVPSGLQLDHLCRVRNCCNPDHLEPVTPRINTLRGMTLQAENAAKTNCPYGHEFTEENTYVDTRGSRRCRTCRNEESRTSIALARRAAHKRKIRKAVADGAMEAPAWMQRNYMAGYCNICMRQYFNLKVHNARIHNRRISA